MAGSTVQKAFLGIAGHDCRSTIPSPDCQVPRAEVQTGFPRSSLVAGYAPLLEQPDRGWSLSQTTSACQDENGRSAPHLGPNVLPGERREQVPAAALSISMNTFRTEYSSSVLSLPADSQNSTASPLPAIRDSMPAHARSTGQAASPGLSGDEVWRKQADEISDLSKRSAALNQSAAGKERQSLQQTLGRTQSRHTGRVGSAASLGEIHG